MNTPGAEESPVPRPRPDAPKFHAHTDPRSNDPRDREPLFTPQCAALTGGHCEACERLERTHGHLNKVAWWTAKFAEEMFPPGSAEAKAAREWGWVAGLWHDLGKFAPEWQHYLASKADLHSDETSGRMDHSTAGAKHAAARSTYGALLAYAMAGHHAGLADGTKLRERLQKSVPLEAARQAARSLDFPLDAAVSAPPFNCRADSRTHAAFALGFFARMIFSSLVDADYLATEAFMDPERAASRPNWPEDALARMKSALSACLKEKERGAADNAVNRQRRLVREACLAAAEQPPGVFSLTVPTGGGKTLSSLAFALEHARRHGLRRVIYVIPYTSIIEQNAAEFRAVFATLSQELGGETVLEHHSNLDPDRETVTNRLMAENWDSPLVVTTNVQFFESLFAAKTSRCRKLHRLARSVVIFDEAQSLPVSLLSPCLSALKSLSRDFGASLVLCTATQPALDRRENFPIGFDPAEVREIIPQREALFSALRRTCIVPLGARTDDEIVAHFETQQSASALFIVNLRRHARALFERLHEREGAFHLSAQMCPEHRSEVLAIIRRRLAEKLPVLLVSTRVVEAGVDVSFPLLYRAEGGLDSLAQAAGRCNRHGELRDENGAPTLGRVFSFTAADFPLPPILKDMREAASAAGQLEEKHRDDLLGLAAIEEYFQLHYWQRREQTNGWDQPPGNHPAILSLFELGASTAELFYSLNFASAAEAFRLIDSPMKPVVIPWRKNGEALWARLRSCEIGQRNPTRADFRLAQRLTVQIPISAWEKLHAAGQLHLFVDGALPMLINARLYDDQFGLNTDNTDNLSPLIC
jgi:CRISPR-associated endonuclease/helicase Cas3